MSEHNELKKEKERLEDQQLQNFEEKRAASVKKTHERLLKIKKLEERNKK